VGRRARSFSTRLVGSDDAGDTESDPAGKLLNSRLIPNLMSGIGEIDAGDGGGLRRSKNEIVDLVSKTDLEDGIATEMRNPIFLSNAHHHLQPLKLMRHIRHFRRPHLVTQCRQKLRALLPTSWLFRLTHGDDVQLEATGRRRTFAFWGKIN